MDNDIKWKLPGWRIEQEYDNKVLLGNWAEDRRKFRKGSYHHNSTQREHFRDFGSSRPDVIVRRNAEVRNAGIDWKYIFNHHGDRYAKNMITMYDEHINQREREPEDKLPELRRWDKHGLAWVPEKSDFPMQGRPTREILPGQHRPGWSDENYLTTYNYSYMRFPRNFEPPGPRYVIPKVTSAKMHPYNRVNQDLNLRGTSRLQAPEILPFIKPGTFETMANVA